jgi:PilZ domain
MFKKDDQKPGTPAKRFQTNEEISIEIYGQISSLLGKMKNLSKTGARLDIVFGQTIPKQGELLNLTVHLASLDKIRKFDAEVIWHRGNSVGISFISKAKVIEKLISSYMDPTG